MSYDAWLERPYQERAAESDAYVSWCESNDLDPDPTGHAVMAYGPTLSPADMSMPELFVWHVADHEGEPETGPKDGHRHA